MRTSVGVVTAKSRAKCANGASAAIENVSLYKPPRRTVIVPRPLSVPPRLNSSRYTAVSDAGVVERAGARVNVLRDVNVAALRTTATLVPFDVRSTLPRSIVQFASADPEVSVSNASENSAEGVASIDSFETNASRGPRNADCNAPSVGKSGAVVPPER